MAYYPSFPTYYDVSKAFHNSYYNNRVVSLHSAVLSVLGDIMYIRRRGKHHHSLQLTDKLSLKLEPLNEEDPYAVAVIRQSDVVGHIPREIFRHVYQSRRHHAGETT